MFTWFLIGHQMISEKRGKWLVKKEENEVYNKGVTCRNLTYTFNPLFSDLCKLWTVDLKMYSPINKTNKLKNTIIF